ncbi:DUF5677 domain-containing protein [Acinetobacter pittii]|uniref:DUF5677 domain-containing protein n=1 Tax=Acinetobacter pittii TaxID=48296 RepID=UPI00083DAFCA|nr:DUF5677 domain-containing protein [Acinetobacter pittii]MCK0911667.1 DUF5677 domain-containing protein [Acinetobacter pittii]
MCIGERKFINAFKSYSRTLNLAVKISRLGAGRYGEKNKVIWACILFTKLCTTGKSLRKLLDHDAAKEYKADWDYSSAFSLTRNMMECYQTLFYLCFDNISEEEFIARKALFNLHDYYSRKQLFSFFPEQSDDKRENPEVETIILEQLKNSTFFQNLDEKKRNKYLKGKDAFFMAREDIEEKEGVSKNDFRLWYKLLSANIHSFPMGFYGMIDGERGTSVHSEIEERYSALALDLAESYLIRACVHMLKIFPDILEKMSPQEKNLIY